MVREFFDQDHVALIIPLVIRRGIDIQLYRIFVMSFHLRYLQMCRIIIYGSFPPRKKLPQVFDNKLILYTVYNTFFIVELFGISHSFE